MHCTCQQEIVVRLRATATRRSAKLTATRMHCHRYQHQVQQFFGLAMSLHSFVLNRPSLPAVQSLFPLSIATRVRSKKAGTR